MFLYCADKMSANASPRVVRYVVLGSAPAEFSSHQIEMDCGNSACRKERCYLISDLAGVHGKGMTVSRLIKRLRCQECGGKAVSVALLRPIGVRKPALICVPQWGRRRGIERWGRRDHVTVSSCTRMKMALMLTSI
jgi:hypothetical protein